MAFIKVVFPQQSSGRLREIYRRVQAPDGQVDNVLKAHSLRPHTLEGHMGLYKSVLHHSANRLPGWYLEAIGVLVSQINGCTYCAGHHSAGMQQLMLAADMDADAYLSTLQTGTPAEPFTPAEQRGLAYACKLTHAPGQIEAADIETLRDAGFDDGEILELNQVAAYFAYANRTVSGLGVSSAGEVLGQSPATTGDDGDWLHG